jgi:hypothetical protein
MVENNTNNDNSIENVLCRNEFFTRQNYEIIKKVMFYYKTLNDSVYNNKRLATKELTIKAELKTF